MSQRSDPVESAADGSRDLYDIATWEERTSLDGLAVALYRLVVGSARIGVILLALLLLVGIGGLSALTDPAIGALTLLSAIPALGLAAYVWYTDVTTDEPISVLIATFLLGVLTANFAAIVNSILQPAFRGVLGVGIGTVLFYFVVVGPVEETVKLLAVRLYAYTHDSFDAVIDGAVYGAMAGLGFATIENALYITQQVNQADLGLGLITAGGGIAAVRALAGPGHVIYSAFAGYYLGLAKFNPENRGPIVIKGLILATVIHATYNSTVSLGTGIIASVTGLPGIVAFFAYVVLYDGLFGLMLIRKIKRYRDVFQETNAADAAENADEAA